MLLEDGCFHPHTFSNTSELLWAEDGKGHESFVIFSAEICDTFESLKDCKECVSKTGKEFLFYEGEYLYLAVLSMQLWIESKVVLKTVKQFLICLYILQ